jgi:hypothetical protein
MTVQSALLSLKSAIAAFPVEKVTASEIEDFLNVKVKRHPGEFEDEPSNEQKSYFVRGGRA